MTEPLIVSNVQHWTRDMEKQVADRVQTVLCSPALLSVHQAFGGHVFRRSSVFHGLERFLAANNVRGKRCLEIGTWNGLTAVVLSQCFDEVVTIDIAPNPIKHKIIAHLGIKNIRCVDIEDNAGKEKVIAPLAFDCAYLDGNHAEDTPGDWVLVKRCGRVLMHEALPFQPPVWDLVQSLPQDQVVYGGYGLAIWTAP